MILALLLLFGNIVSQGSGSLNNAFEMLYDFQIFQTSSLCLPLYLSEIRVRGQVSGVMLLDMNVLRISPQHTDSMTLFRILLMLFFFFFFYYSQQCVSLCTSVR